MTIRRDSEQATRDSRQKAKPASAAPHYMRCEWYDGTRRCRLSEGHPGDHEYENPQKE
jgi:hypothetical protein